MSKAFEKELSKLNIEINDTIYIPKRTDIKLVVGNVFIIKLSYNALHPASNSTITANWNQGGIPTCEYYKAHIEQIVNNMIKFTGIKYIPETKQTEPVMWTGWLDKADIEVLAAC